MVIDLRDREVAELKRELEAARAELQNGYQELLAQSQARQETIVELRSKYQEKDAELEIARIATARVIHALDAALQWGEALFAYLPEGQPVHPGLAAAKEALDDAMKGIRGSVRTDRQPADRDRAREH